jgi:hypothetical protein
MDPEVKMFIMAIVISFILMIVSSMEINQTISNVGDSYNNASKGISALFIVGSIGSLIALPMINGLSGKQLAAFLFLIFLVLISIGISSMTINTATVDPSDKYKEVSKALSGTALAISLVLLIASAVFIAKSRQ